VLTQILISVPACLIGYFLRFDCSSEELDNKLEEVDKCLIP